MAKKLLSPELNQVLKDIENAREAINEKYAINGRPDPIQAPLLSGDLANRIKDIFVVNTDDGTAEPKDVIKGKVFYVNGERRIGDMPELTGNIELDVNTLFVNLPPGYYPEGIHTEIKDYTVSYVWNLKGMPAQTQHPKFNGNFTIPDFSNIIEMPEGYELLGWSHMADDEDPEFETGDRLSQYDLAIQHDTAYLYAIWKALAPPVVYTLYGTVKDAVTDNPITEICRLKFRGEGQTAGVATANIITSANDGYYETSDVPFGAKYNVEVSANGYDTEYFAIELPTDETSAERNFVLSPHMTDNEFLRAIVDWENQPRDVDTHIREVSGTSGIDSSNASDIINYSKKSHVYDNGAELTLDVDNTQGCGPETITLKNSNNVSFVYYLVNFSKDCNMSHTGVHVRIKTPNSATRDISMRPQDTNYLIWNVFKYENGVITILDTYEYPHESSSGSGSSTPTERPIDMRLSDLSINVGTLNPSFNSDTRDYTLTVPFDTKTITFNGTVIDNRATYKINNSTSNTLTIKDETGTLIRKAEVDVCARTEYTGIPSINTTDGTVGRYTINITEQSDPQPVNPSAPETRQTATILLPDVPSDFNTIPNGSCIEYKYGWYELGKQPNHEKLRIAYTRIYNMFLNNGQKINNSYKHTLTMYDGTVHNDIPLFIDTDNITVSATPKSEFGIYEANCDFPLPESTQRKELTIYLFDLELSEDDVKYVFSLVIEDCPEVLSKFQRTYSWNKYAKTYKLINGSLEPYGDEYVLYIKTEFFFKEDMRQTMLQTCVDTLNDINRIIDETYGIKFCNQNFALNNKLYSVTEMIKIGKVVHDYLEANNIYGREGGHYINQTMYPALSNGKWNPVCASYSRAFQYCCWRWGINAMNVSGICDTDGNGQPEDAAGHAWSLVSYQNKTVNEIMSSSNPGRYWQEVDCTWDDSGPSCGYDYGTRQVSSLTADYNELITNTQKTSGWNNSNTCRWTYFNITTEEINNNTPGVTGTSGGAGCRARRTDYKMLVKGTSRRYTYNGATLYGGFESITE